jgi:hypothetical protein
MKNILQMKYLTILCLVLVSMSQFSKAELVKRDPFPTFPDIKVNSDALTFLPHNFIDVRKYLPSSAENLEVTSSIGDMQWNDEGQNYPINEEDLKDTNYMKFVELIPQGLFNLGSIKFYYDGPFGEGDAKKDVKACALVGYEHPNNVWQDKIELSQEQCHRVDMSETNEDDIITTWITQEGEGDAKKTFVNVRIRHLKSKEQHVDKFEDTLGLFANNEYLSTSFVQYKRPNVVPGSKDLPFGMKGMIYTRQNTSKQGSFYFFEHEDHSD